MQNYGDAEAVEPLPSPAPDWVDLAAVYPEDLRPPAQPPPQMEVALLPASATLSTMQKRIELTVQVRGARDLAGFIMKLRYDPAFLRPLASEVDVGRDFARVGLDPAVRGPVEEASDELLFQGTAVVDEGKGISGRVEVARLPFGILGASPVSTRVDILSFKAVDTNKESGWVEATTLESSQLSLRTRGPRTLISLAPGEEVQRSPVPVVVGECFPVYILAQDWRAIAGIQFDLRYSGARLEDLGYDEGEFLLREGRPVRLDLDTAAQANQARARPRQRVRFPQRDRLPAGNGAILAFYFKPLETGRAIIQLRNVYFTDSRRMIGNSALSDEVEINVVARRPR